MGEMHKFWSAAKAESKKKYKEDLKKYYDDLNQRCKDGDPVAIKIRDENFRAGFDNKIDAEDDPEKFFKFKSDFGENLDKLEKAKGNDLKTMKTKVQGLVKTYRDEIKGYKGVVSLNKQPNFTTPLTKCLDKVDGMLKLIK